MPGYKTVGAVSISGLTYQDGASVTLSAGTLRDDLLAAGAIFRPDLPPYKPRGWGEIVLLPIQWKSSPQHARPPLGIFLPGAAFPSGFDPTTWSSIVSRYATEAKKWFEPVDEWSLEAWPWAGEWWWYPRGLAPKRGLRPIP